MTFKYKILTLIALIFLFVSGNKSLGQSKGSHLPAFTVIITEKESNEPMAYAVCSLIRTDSIAGQRFTATADEDGRCFFHENVPTGTYQAHVFYMGQTFHLPDQGVFLLPLIHVVLVELRQFRHTGVHRDTAG